LLPYYRLRLSLLFVNKFQGTFGLVLPSWICHKRTCSAYRRFDLDHGRTCSQIAIRQELAHQPKHWHQGSLHMLTLSGDRCFYTCSSCAAPALLYLPVNLLQRATSCPSSAAPPSSTLRSSPPPPASTAQMA